MAEELATPKHESPCRGGFKTRPYAWTFTLKPVATGKIARLTATCNKCEDRDVMYHAPVRWPAEQSYHIFLLS
jgi:hypothetical protein